MVARGWKESRRLGRHTIGSNVFRFFQAPCGGRVELAADMDRVDDGYGPNIYEERPPHHLWMLTTRWPGGGAVSSEYLGRVQLFHRRRLDRRLRWQPQDVFNPATGESGTVPHAGAADLDRALAAASRAFQEWSDKAVDERGQVLHRAAALIRERADQIARTMTLEQGKPFSEARGEIFGSTKLLDSTPRRPSATTGGSSRLTQTPS